MKTFLTIVICLVIGFLGGFLPVTLKKAEIAGQLTDCTSNLETVELQLDRTKTYFYTLNDFIGAYEATVNKNFGIAKTRAISGFDSAEDITESPLGDISAQRDEIVSLLAQGGDDAEPKMRELLFSLYQSQ